MFFRLMCIRSAGLRSRDQAGLPISGDDQGELARSPINRETISYSNELVPTFLAMHWPKLGAIL
jgi:hypothetical protein